MSDVNRTGVPGTRRWVTRRLASRALARTAIAGTAVGIAVLATLAVVGSAVTSDATTQVRRAQEITRAWNNISSHINGQDAALRGFLATGGTQYRRSQLDQTIDSARSDLDWLQEHDAIDRVELDVIRGAYANYSRIVVQIMAMVGREASVQGYAELASLAFAPLRDEVLENVRHNDDKLTGYLAGVDQRTAFQRMVAAIIIPFCAVVFGLCAVVLVGYQRRAERQAASRLHDATHDPLTGLGNRTLLGERLRTAIGNTDDAGEPFCLLLIDLDRFKEVNDTLGHHCGDQLLVGVAERLVGASREGDEVVRLGGDEFALVMPNTPDRAGALEAARRVLAALRQPMDLDGITVDVDASIGVSLYPADGTDAPGLLRHADVAMYTAKRAHAGVAAYDPDQDQNDANKLTMQSDLRQGVSRGELVLYYQPKIDMATGQPSGMEALLRWQHPQLGLLAPDRFIPMAEETGLIDLITTEVLDMALRQVREWYDAGRALRVSVNVAARSLFDVTFPEQVVAALERYDVPPELLTLEITETALIADPERANLVLERLRAHGVDISIDDFGTGYSSIAHLRAMPPHELKIDRSFVMRMCTDARDETIVRAVVELAKGLNLRVVAEGVEDAGAFEALSALGCDEAQGYHISRPLPPAELAAWLETVHENVMVA
ncbi:putative bifunctional diguanylate cyclase/phosphodiesterase [Paractinoplanes rishiriensis]|uniref:putative bifunctional diguanylate cyclase/phosphodiesterase n=1 Tax=Paractinoplanes rishiriensis TaxID=1050105 RepID=UPI0019424249|nr:EAL domain-containing protein [Actinoplanes rishiriensis]